MLFTLSLFTEIIFVLETALDSYLQNGNLFFPWRSRDYSEITIWTCCDLCSQGFAEYKTALRFNMLHKKWKLNNWLFNMNIKHVHCIVLPCLFSASKNKSFLNMKNTVQFNKSIQKTDRVIYFLVLHLYNDLIYISIYKTHTHTHQIFTACWVCSLMIHCYYHFAPKCLKFA